MIASSNPLQFDEPASVPKAEHLQKCVHAKAYNKLGHIVVSAQRANKKWCIYINLYLRKQKITLLKHHQVE